MTKIAAGLEAFRGAGGISKKPEKWFVYQDPIQTGVLQQEQYSETLPDGAVIKEVQLHAFADVAFSSILVGVKVFICTDNNLSAAQVAVQECIINFQGGALPGRWWAAWGPRDESYKLYKKIQGSNKKIGISVWLSTADNVGVRVAVRYKEP